MCILNGDVYGMRKRINVTLPEETLQLIDRVVQPGQRSCLISEAVQHYVEAMGWTNLREQLREGAVRRAERDLEIAQEWFGDEVWESE